MLFSCTKIPAPNNPPPPVTNLVISIMAYYPVNRSKSIEHFTYDSSKNLVILNQRGNDTSQGVFYLDSGSWYFTIDPLTNMTVSYTSIYKKSFYTVNDEQVHNMYFDNQKRVVLDSVVSATNQQGGPTSVHYTYANNIIVAYEYLTNSSNQISQYVYIDSMVLSNGNLVRKAGYSINNGSLTPEYIYTVNGYSTDMNPLYNPDLSNSLGAYLVHQNLFDGLSKNLTSDGGGNWVKDSKGRVVSGTDSGGLQLTFIYQ